MKTAGYRIRDVLTFPYLYDTLQGLVGADRCRAAFLNEYATPRAGERMLDIGCGTGRVLRALPPGVQYVGVDTNPRYIAQAAEHYKGRGLFLVGSSNLPELEPLGPFDIVTAMFLMHHLNDEELRSLARDVCRLLSPNGRFVTIDPCLVPDAGPVERYIVQRDRGAYVRSAEGYKSILSNVFDSIEIFLRRDLLRIPYSHVIMRARREKPLA